MKYENIVAITETSIVYVANSLLKDHWKLLGVASGDGKFLYSLGKVG